MKMLIIRFDLRQDFYPFLPQQTWQSSVFLEGSGDGNHRGAKLVSNLADNRLRRSCSFPLHLSMWSAKNRLLRNYFLPFLGLNKWFSTNALASSSLIFSQLFSRRLLSCLYNFLHHWEALSTMILLTDLRILLEVIGPVKLAKSTRL